MEYSRVGPAGYNCQLHHLAAWTQAGHVSSLSHQFLICKMVPLIFLASSISETMLIKHSVWDQALKKRFVNIGCHWHHRDISQLLHLTSIPGLPLLMRCRVFPRWSLPSECQDRPSFSFIFFLHLLRIRINPDVKTLSQTFAWWGQWEARLPIQRANVQEQAGPSPTALFVSLQLVFHHCQPVCFKPHHSRFITQL